METRVQSIPLNKLVPSDRNVRRTGREAGVEALAASIAAHGLLQNLTVRPANAGARYEVIAGGRRLTALKLLAKAKTIAKDHRVDCLVLDDQCAEEVSLAENVVRESLHPADQFEAFQRLHVDEGQSCEDIAARFGVTAAVVRQRLRLSTVSPVLIQAYRDDEMTLEQLMAFTITPDHERQVAVWAGLSWNRDPGAIRRALSADQVRGSDRRAVFVGAEAYEAAGGVVQRDLFAEDGGGYFTDPALLDRLVLERLEAVATNVRSTGWKWVSVSIDLPVMHTSRRLYPSAQALPAADQTRLDDLAREYDALVTAHEADDELSDELAGRLEAVSAEIEDLDQRRYAYDPDDISRAGAVVWLGHNGEAKVEGGFVRPEDERNDAASEDGGAIGKAAADRPRPDIELDGHQPLSDRLIADLTAQRSAALQDRLAENPEAAMLALTHALALQVFYVGHDLGSCLEIRASAVVLAPHSPSIREGRAGQSIEARHSAWAVRVPAASADLWTFVCGLDPSERSDLLAHCASTTLNAVRGWERRTHALAHADDLAALLELDMAAYWRPTVASYFGHVTKAHILDVVREAVSDEAAKRIESLKKGEMAEAAQALVADAAWLPPLLTAGRADGEVKGS